MPTYTFSERAARAILREVRELQRKTENVTRLAQAAARMPRAPRIEYAQPQSSLQVGGTCEAILCPWNGTAYSPDSRLVIQVEDLHGWAFAIGVDDWASSPHLLPVIESPKRGFFEVASPFGLMQQCKPDATITAGSSGTASIYAGSTDTGVNVTLHADWGEGGLDITSGAESWASYSIEQARWNYSGGEC